GLALPAQAIQPSQWQHTTEADFEPGKREGTIVTNLGDIKLAVGSEVVGEMPEKATILYDLVELGGTVYLAAGPEAKLLAQRDGKIEEIASLGNEQIFSLATFNGELLVAISGAATSRLAVLRDGA